MRFAIPAAALVACMTVAAPASAATVVLTGSSTTSGNSLLYSSGPVRFSATALTYTNSLTPSVSAAIKYTEGLGIDPAGDDRHTIDNSQGYDFILLRFESAVALTGASFANLNWYNDSSPDTDATISFAPVALSSLGQSYSTNLSGSAGNAFFNAVGTPLYDNSFDSNSTALVNGYSNRTFNGGVNPNVSQVWIIGASITNLDRKVDSFKLKSITYGVPPSTGTVPEPATWALLILGFGTVGGALRRKVRAKLAFF